jgi:hypothetical protein
MKKSLSELEASAEARAAGRGAGAGARSEGTAAIGRASMEAREGKGLVSGMSKSTAGWVVRGR